MNKYEWAVRYEYKIIDKWITHTTSVLEDEEEAQSFCELVEQFELENPDRYQNARKVRRLVSDWQELDNGVDTAD